MRRWLVGVLVVSALGGSTKDAGADAFLLASIDVSLQQWVGCQGSCFPSGSIRGRVEILYDAETYRVIGSTPFEALLPNYDGPRLTAFGGTSAYPGYDCTGEDGPSCYMMRYFDYTERSTGWRRHFWLEGLFPIEPDPYLGLLPSWFDIRESGTLDGRDVMFMGAGGVANFQAVNSSLQPIPEPSTMLLVFGGLVGLVARNRRRSVL